MDLVEPLRPRHLVVDLDEERRLTDQRRRVILGGAKAEVAMPIRRTHRRDHQRALRLRAQNVEDLGEVVQDQVALLGPVRGPRDVLREEIGT